MKAAPLHIAADVQALMDETRKQVAARLLALFKTAPMIEALGQERATRLVALISDADRLGRLQVVSSQVREAIIEARPHNLGRWTLWNIIDAIGSLADCEPGRWPYFTDENRRRNLGWAGEELDEAEGAVRDALGATEDAAELMAA